MRRVEIVRRIGRGAGSEVFLTRDPTNGQRFALKVVVRRSAEDEKYLEQAIHEYQVGRMLEHPNLMKVYELEVKRRFFRVREVRSLLEYIDGVVLEQIRADVRFGLAVLCEVAAALEHMHQRGICHADLKPNNVLVRWDGRVKVIDFGLAWIRGQDKQRIQGTRGYLAPEQVMQRRVTPKTDIFNFGVLAHRLLTGTMRPQRAEGHSIGLSGTMLRDVRELNPAVPKALAAVVRACCEEKPQRRPESMHVVRAALAEVAEQLGVSPDQIATHMQAIQQDRRRWR